MLVGPDAGDDAGVFRIGDLGLVATVDFIPPVGDDPRRFGRIAATNSMSDVWAMGGEPLFALNLCSFPDDLPDGVAAEILQGGLEALSDAGAVLLGGHSVRDPELKYGLAVVGRADPDRLITNAGARPGDRLLLTKPIGTGVLINAFRADRIDEKGFEPAMATMERTNRAAARIALEHDVTAATDVTGFGLAGHAWNLARESDLRLRLEIDAVPALPGFAELFEAGVSTGCTPKNRDHVRPHVEIERDLEPARVELLYDPQTSGPLLLAIPEDRADACLAALLASGHLAAEIGRVEKGEPALVVS